MWCGAGPWPAKASPTNPGWTCAKTCWPGACSCCSTASAATFHCISCARTASSSHPRCGSCTRSCASTCNRCCLACRLAPPAPVLRRGAGRQWRPRVRENTAMPWMGIRDLWTFLVAVLVFLALPGPGTFTLLTATGRGGVRGGYTALAGLLVGDQILMWLALAGVAALLKANPLVFHAVQYLGAAYRCGWASACCARPSTRVATLARSACSPAAISSRRSRSACSIRRRSCSTWPSCRCSSIRRHTGHRHLRRAGRHHPGGQYRLLLDADRRGQPGPSPVDPAPADQRCAAPRGRPVPGGVRHPARVERVNGRLPLLGLALLFAGTASGDPACFMPIPAVWSRCSARCRQS